MYKWHLKKLTKISYNFSLKENFVHFRTENFIQVKIKSVLLPSDFNVQCNKKRKNKKEKECYFFAMYASYIFFDSLDIKYKSLSWV